MTFYKKCECGKVTRTILGRLRHLYNDNHGAEEKL